MKKKFTFYFLLFALFFSNQCYAQDDWTLLKDESGIQVFYQSVSCSEHQEIDPLAFDGVDESHETFKLKIINSNVSSTSITFSKVTKTDDTDELVTIIAESGTTLLESCEEAPKMMLTKQDGDQYPIAFTDFLNDFVLTIENE